MKILVVNAGSSSLKFELQESSTGQVLGKGVCERIGLDGAITYKAKDDKYEATVDLPDHKVAVKEALDCLVEGDLAVIDSLEEIEAVGHRVVHGGEVFSGAALITDEVMEAIEACVPLAPLHNPPNLEGIVACQNVLNDVPMVAVFDTAFHQTMPDYAYMYALPYNFYEDYSVRRYGFHGTSHDYVSQEAAKMLGKDISELNIITCHLGNGSSITAVKNGEVVDTSMGLTPLAGVPMGTRSGDLDPAILNYLHEQNEAYDLQTLDRIMNKESGVLGISGVSSDFRDIEEAADGGNKRARLALDMFAYSVRKYIGSYAAAMGGVDAIVFTAGVGENSATTRAGICEGLEFLGVKLDLEKNEQRADQLNISAAAATVQTLVIATDEEFMIAKQTAEIVEAL